MSVWPARVICAPACSAKGGQKRAPVTLELEWQMVVSCPVSVRNQTMVLWVEVSALNH